MYTLYPIHILYIVYISHLRKTSQTFQVNLDGQLQGHPFRLTQMAGIHRCLMAGLHVSIIH
jgi:hypothetical protein